MLRKLALSSLLLSVPAMPASADVLFSTNQIDVSPRTSDHGLDAGGFQTFDNFRLPDTAEVEIVSWQGFWVDFGQPTPAPAPTPDVTTWQVTFFADNGGVPGAALATHLLAPASVSSTFLGNGIFNGPNSTSYSAAFYDYRVALPTAFAATGGDTYWFSVLSLSPISNTAFAWRAASNGLDDLSYQQRLSASMVVLSEGAVARDRAFSLEGTPIPEPASLLLLGVALAGFAGRRRRSTR